jgi:DNA-directed RNA polymerase
MFGNDLRWFKFILVSLSIMNILRVGNMQDSRVAAYPLPEHTSNKTTFAMNLSKSSLFSEFAEDSEFCVVSSLFVISELFAISELFVISELVVISELFVVLASFVVSEVLLESEEESVVVGVAEGEEEEGMEKSEGLGIGLEEGAEEVVEELEVEGEGVVEGGGAETRAYIFLMICCTRTRTA